MLRKAGWDDAPHAINEQRTFTDGRIVIAGGKARRGRQKRADYILRYRSHCVPESGGPSVEFLLYYFLSREGLRCLGEASPGGAGRNRTLGLKKLAAIAVPVPSPEKQRWFDRLQAKIGALRKAHTETSGELDALIPAMLHEVFGGEAGCSGG